MTAKKEPQKEEGRVVKSVRNIGYGVAFQIINAAMSFISRSFMIRYLGLDAVSLHGLFWEIITMISMTELGISFAITYNLYEPLSNNDTKKVTQLMQMYKKAYRVIALITFIAGSIMAIFIPYIVNGLHYDNKEVRIIFMLYVLQSALSYLFTYKLTLLSADQNKYIYTKIQSWLRVAGAAVLILIMVLTKSFIYYLIVDIFISLITNVVSSIAADRRYPYINDKVEKLEKKEQKKIFSNIKDVFIKKLSGQITNSTDNILISTLVGTSLVGYYANYSAIFSVFIKLESQISSGFSASLGNLIVTEGRERVEAVLNKLTRVYFLFAIIVSSCVYACAKPFISIWLGEQYVIESSIVFVCCVNLFLNLVKGPVWQAVDSAGLFKQDKYISIIGNVVNLAVSLVAGYKFGMIGIFAGTTLTLLINLFMKTILFCKNILKNNYWKYVIKWSKMIVMAVVILFVTGIMCEKVVVVSNVYLEFIENGCIAAAVSIVIMWLFFRKTLNLKENIKVLKK